MRLAAGLLIALALAPNPGAAQTFHEAVRANVWLAMHLCFADARSPEEWVGRFRSSGFAERVEGGGGDTTHFFTGPAETVSIEIYYGNMPESCRVSSRHMGVNEASELLDAAIGGLRPGYARKVRQGPVDPTTGQTATCVRYEDPANEIGEVLGVLAEVPNDATEFCVPNGTAVIYQSYRV